MLRVKARKSETHVVYFQEVVNGHAVDIEMRVNEEILRIEINPCGTREIMDISIIKSIDPLKVTIDWDKTKYVPDFNCKYTVNSIPLSYVLYPNLTYSRIVKSIDDIYMGTFWDEKSLIRDLNIYPLDEDKKS